MHTALNVLWLVVYKTVVNFWYSLELAAYLGLGLVDRPTVGGLVLEQLDEGAGWAEIRIFLWWDWAWATDLLDQHERRRELRDSSAWR